MFGGGWKHFSACLMPSRRAHAPRSQARAHLRAGRLLAAADALSRAAAGSQAADAAAAWVADARARALADQNARLLQAHATSTAASLA
jgi:hypothetical protein